MAVAVFLLPGRTDNPERRAPAGGGMRMTWGNWPGRGPAREEHPAVLREDARLAGRLDEERPETDPYPALPGIVADAWGVGDGPGRGPGRPAARGGGWSAFDSSAVAQQVLLRLPRLPDAPAAAPAPRRASRPAAPFGLEAPAPEPEQIPIGFRVPCVDGVDVAVSGVMASVIEESAGAEASTRGPFERACSDLSEWLARARNRKGGNPRMRRIPRRPVRIVGGPSVCIVDVVGRKHGLSRAAAERAARYVERTNPPAKSRARFSGVQAYRARCKAVKARAAVRIRDEAIMRKRAAGATWAEAGRDNGVAAVSAATACRAPARLKRGDSAADRTIRERQRTGRNGKRRYWRRHHRRGCTVADCPCADWARRKTEAARGGPARRSACDAAATSRMLAELRRDGERLRSGPRPAPAAPPAAPPAAAPNGGVARATTLRDTRTRKAAGASAGLSSADRTRPAPSGPGAATARKARIRARMEALRRRAFGERGGGVPNAQTELGNVTRSGGRGLGTPMGNRPGGASNAGVE